MGLCSVWSALHCSYQLVLGYAKSRAGLPSRTNVTKLIPYPYNNEQPNQTICHGKPQTFD